MKKLFALGLILQIIAQVLFSVHSEEVNLMEPFDIIHWLFLIGVVLILPYVFNFSEGIYQAVGVCLTSIGIVSNIGMCIIDFVLWSFRSDTVKRAELISHLMDEPLIWPIFITIGPAFLFVGLAIQAISHLRVNAIGSIGAIFGSILVGIGGVILPELRILYILGYLLFAGGLLLIAFDIKAKIGE